MSKKLKRARSMRRITLRRGRIVRAPDHGVAFLDTPEHREYLRRVARGYYPRKESRDEQ